MYSFLVTTTRKNDGTPKIVVIGDPSDYSEHLAKYHRISYFPGYDVSCYNGARIAKKANIAVVNTPTVNAYKLIEQLSSVPFSTIGANMKTIDLQSEYPELFV